MDPRSQPRILQANPRQLFWLTGWCEHGSRALLGLPFVRGLLHLLGFSHVTPRLHGLLSLALSRLGERRTRVESRFTTDEDSELPFRCDVGLVSDDEFVIECGT